MSLTSSAHRYFRALWLLLALAAACQPPPPAPIPDDVSTYSDCVTNRQQEGCTLWP